VINTSASSNPVCPFDNTTLTATGANSYTWMPFGLPGSTIQITPNANITLTVIGSIGNCSSSSPITITVTPNPTLSVVSTDSLLCIGYSATLTAGGASSYTWLPSNATGSFIVVSPSVNTTYTLIGASGTCSDQTTFTQNVSACTSLVDVSFNQIFHVYPNPAHDIIQLVAPSGTLFKIVDAIGKVISFGMVETNVRDINVSNLSNGIYFMILEFNNKISSIKVIKE